MALAAEVNVLAFASHLVKALLLNPTPPFPHLNIDSNSLNSDNKPERNRETLNLKHLCSYQLSAISFQKTSGPS
jgi:hypothetical protein